MVDALGVAGPQEHGTVLVPRVTRDRYIAYEMSNTKTWPILTRKELSRWYHTTRNSKEDLPTPEALVYGELPLHGACAHIMDNKIVELS